jgi:Sulfotransferase family
MTFSSGSSMQSCRYFLTSGRSRLLNAIALVTDMNAGRFYNELLAGGYLPNTLVDVVPEHRLIYVNIPKCASTTIRRFLSQLIGREPAPTTDAQHIRKISGLKSPRHLGITNFYRIATAPDTLRFSFVGNPYRRLVSAWADKFQNKPLVRGNRIIDEYLTHRASIDSSLPYGPDAALTFPEFVTYATATANSRVNIHWQSQLDILNMPGISLDFIGRVESFATDFSRVLDHVNAPEHLRQDALVAKNASSRERCCDHFTPALAKRVYRAYECDFDRLHYPRAVPD